MFFHVVIETNEKVGKSAINKEYFELDKQDLTEITKLVVTPYLKKEEFQFDGYFLKPENIKRIAIKQTDRPTREIAEERSRRAASNGIFIAMMDSDVVDSKDHAKDITAKVFDDVKAGLNSSAQAPSKMATTAADVSKVFIVHGRDDHAKVEAARFIEKLGFEAIILHEQPSGGKTIIEKIEAYTNVGFAVVLYTPCDVGGLAGDTQKPRARQNVVFEHGYLIGKLGRKNVCALVKGNVEKPNDISGVVYVDMDAGSGWHLQLAKELRESGYKLDMNKVI